ncbi:hypothetical protein PHISCL_04942 [Aspergillus sclerotialis]|uniref:Hsp70 protein n=1 Tax=Aspergillus sclerotialis TaxID=2070753 RepID=A0A3A2ZI55_9EURO|nr:hypothetical protein PHISCL_04942 [Aspergillus sclerotialis]
MPLDEDFNSLKLGSNSTNRHKIIVGVDYGTTYSGISYVESTKTRLEDINVITSWPDERGTSWKTPTRIAYVAENKDLSSSQWGFSVTPRMKSYSWTKLLLDKNTPLTKFDDNSLRDLYGEGLLSLPRGKTAQKVVEDYLRYLYRHLMHTLEKQLGQAVLKSTPIECYLTMPAIWSDQAQLATREAAKAAGFASRPGDTLAMIAEPEAAAIAAMKPNAGPDAISLLKPGENIMICDCGGGTVDITTYTVKSSTPTLQFTELCPGIGGKCGSTHIDRNFNRWMTETFGDAYESVPFERRGPGSRFMESFNSAKRNFTGKTQSSNTIEVGPLTMKVDSSEHYDEDERAVLLTKDIMQSLFDPVVVGIIRLIEEQTKAAKKKNAQVSRLILVGGFGDSEYLNKRLKHWCKCNEVNSLTCPPDCQAAIVRGAALRGLEGISSMYTHCHFHYGWSWGLKFREGIDKEEHAYITAYDKVKMCNHRMHWEVAKGQSMDANFTTTTGVAYQFDEGDDMISTLSLYSCSRDDPPEYSFDHGVRKVGVIETDFSDVDRSIIESKYDKSKKMRVYKIHYDVNVSFRGATGILEFTSLINGEVIGKTSLRRE